MAGLVGEEQLAGLVPPGVDRPHRIDEVGVAIVVYPTPDVGIRARAKTEDQHQAKNNFPHFHTTNYAAVTLQSL